MPKYASRTRHFARRLYKRMRYTEKNLPKTALYLSKNFHLSSRKTPRSSKPTLLTAPACRNFLLPAGRIPSPQHAPLLPQRTCPRPSKHNKAPSLFRVSRLVVKWRRPTLPRVCSTIGAVGLNFSVRNGKRWNPVAITTGNIS